MPTAAPEPQCSISPWKEHIVWCSAQLAKGILGPRSYTLQYHLQKQHALIWWIPSTPHPSYISFFCGAKGSILSKSAFFSDTVKWSLPVCTPLSILFLQMDWLKMNRYFPSKASALQLRLKVQILITGKHAYIGKDACFWLDSDEQIFSTS